MADIDLGFVIAKLRPSAQFTLDNNDYDTLVWFSDDAPPTKQECEAAWPQVRNDELTREAEASRRRAFTAEADPLFFEWQRGEGTEQAWRDKVEEIRQRYPYPT